MQQSIQNENLYLQLLIPPCKEKHDNIGTMAAAAGHLGPGLEDSNPNSIILITAAGAARVPRTGARRFESGFSVHGGE